MNESVCKKCGATLTEGARFCPECGANQFEQNTNYSNSSIQGSYYGGANPNQGGYYGGANPNQGGYYGGPVPNQSPYGTPNHAPQDAPSAGFAVLGFFIPIVGLILYLVWMDTTPLRAKSVGKGALIGAIVSIVMAVIGVVLGFTILSASFEIWR